MKKLFVSIMGIILLLLLPSIALGDKISPWNSIRPTLKELKIGDNMPIFWLGVEHKEPGMWFGGSKQGITIACYEDASHTKLLIMVAFLICKDKVLKIPFGVYIFGTDTLYLDNVMNGKIDEIVKLGTEDLMIHLFAPSCEGKEMIDSFKI